MSIIYSREQDGTLNVLCSGTVVRDPEIKQGNNAIRVKFSVAYGKKKYMDCEAWADNDVGAVAACLEKGDIIAVMGTHRTWEYNGKTYATLSADMVFTLASAPPPVAAEPQPPNEARQSAPFKEIMDSTDEELPF